VLQAFWTDAAILVGLGVIGVGVAQISRPLMWMYVGCVLVLVGVVSAVAAAREKAAPTRRSDA